MGDSASISNPNTDCHVRDSMSTRWTDEKHSTFLNSIEASFVEQLYSNQYFPNDLPCWLSRWKKCVQSSGSDQCKITYGECLESQNPVSETTKTHKSVKIDSVYLGSKQCIRLFKSIPTINETESKSIKNIDDSEFVSHMLQEQSWKYTEAKSLPKLSSMPENRPQDSAASIQEMSDQNFVGDELNSRESRICKKKRRLNRKSPGIVSAKDQVVPTNVFLVPNFNMEHTCPDNGNAECSRKPSQWTNCLRDKGN